MSKVSRSLFLAVVLLTVLLTGCSANTIDEMYSLPRRSARNESLRTAIEFAMETRSYAAPVSGDNRESVQVADLNGDGSDEYILFARDTQSNALQILVFAESQENAFGLTQIIDCKGSSFEQVTYVNMDEADGVELIVGTRINEKVTRTVSVYSFESGEPEKLKSMIYERYLCLDADENGRSAILVIQNGSDAGIGAVARLYRYVNGNIEGSAEAALSAAPDSIQRIDIDQLYTGEKAIYVTSAWSDGGTVTDILMVEDGHFSGDKQSVMQDLHNFSLMPEDIDGDGVLELPNVVSIMYNATDEHMIEWFCLDRDGEKIHKCYSFYDHTFGWYLEISKEWIDRISVERNELGYTFYMWNNSYGTAVPVFSVFCLTGKDRDLQAAQQNRFALYRGDDVVYAAKVESASGIYGISENYLSTHFHLIRQEWKSLES